MAKAKKAKVVDGVPQTHLVATQIVGILLADGNTGLAMLSNAGNVFTYNGKGWVRLSMLEDTDDPKV